MSHYNTQYNFLDSTNNTMQVGTFFLQWNNFFSQKLAIQLNEKKQNEWNKSRVKINTAESHLLFNSMLVAKFKCKYHHQCVPNPMLSLQRKSLYDWYIHTYLNNHHESTTYSSSLAYKKHAIARYTLVGNVPPQHKKHAPLGSWKLKAHFSI